MNAEFENRVGCLPILCAGLMGAAGAWVGMHHGFWAAAVSGLAGAIVGGPALFVGLAWLVMFVSALRQRLFGPKSGP